MTSRDRRRASSSVTCRRRPGRAHGLAPHRATRCRLTTIQCSASSSSGRDRDEAIVVYVMCLRSSSSMALSPTSCSTKRCSTMTRSEWTIHDQPARPCGECGFPARRRGLTSYQRGRSSTEARTASPRRQPARAPGVVLDGGDPEADPHRWPILMVDRIVEYDPARGYIRGEKAVTATSAGISRDISRTCRSCRVSQVEALAQTMAVDVAQQEGFGDRIGLFAGIDERRFKRAPSNPATSIRRQVTMDKPGQALRRGKAVASVDGEVCCVATTSASSSRRRCVALMAMRIAVLGDVHGNIGVDAALADIKKHRPDRIAVRVMTSSTAWCCTGGRAGCAAGERWRVQSWFENTQIAVTDYDDTAAFPVDGGRRRRAIVRRRVGRISSVRRAARPAARAGQRTTHLGRPCSD